MRKKPQEMAEHQWRQVERASSRTWDEGRVLLGWVERDERIPTGCCGQLARGGSSPVKIAAVKQADGR